jgi:hypothetical protein
MHASPLPVRGMKIRNQPAQLAAAVDKYLSYGPCYPRLDWSVRGFTRAQASGCGWNMCGEPCLVSYPSITVQYLPCPLTVSTQEATVYAIGLLVVVWGRPCDTVE